MKSLELPLLVLGIAGAMLVASPVEANVKTAAKQIASHSSRPSRKLTPLMSSRKSESGRTDNAVKSESYFNYDYTAQHPSGGLTLLRLAIP